MLHCTVVTVPAGYENEEGDEEAGQGDGQAC